MKPYTRVATHAGSWYDNNPNLIKQWENGGRTNVKAVIGPHAGYRYCGKTLASAYSQITPEKIDTIFLMGPSHYKYIKHCMLSSAEAFQTPFGDIKVSTDIVGKLMASSLFKYLDRDDDEEEHSLEMHCPFIKTVMGDHEFQLVPFLVGDLSWDEMINVSKILKPYFEQENVLFAISSDFCHWGKRFRYTHYNKEDGEIWQSIDKLDHEGLKAISTLNPKTYRDYEDETQNTICGRNPITLLLHCIENSDLKGRVNFKCVDYSQSSQVVDMNDSSVSYAGSIFTV